MKVNNTFRPLIGIKIINLAVKKSILKNEEKVYRIFTENKFLHSTISKEDNKVPVKIIKFLIIFLNLFEEPLYLAHRILNTKIPFIREP